MNFETLLINIEESVAVLSINRPKALNALNSTVLKELEIAIEALNADDAVNVIILTGEGKAFVAGADITEMKEMNAAQAREFGAFGMRVFRKIELSEKPVIAAINGFALGGGCELAMSCDIRIAGEKAKFGQPEVGLGITPGFAGTQRLSRLVGPGKAKELIFTADIIGSLDAEKIGLVNKVVPQEELMDAAFKMAGKIASKAQLAVRYSKSAINRGFETDIETGMVIEQDIFGLCFATEDQTEGMTAFVEKRPAAFKCL
jgi:enoyl-CoA hydratase